MAVARLVVIMGISLVCSPPFPPFLDVVGVVGVAGGVG